MKITKELNYVLVAMLIFLPMAIIVGNHYGIHINSSHSLPYKVFVIKKGVLPNRGDITSFRLHNNAFYSDGTIMTKIVGGIGGDEVTFNNHEFFINDKMLVKAKTYSLKGDPLEAGPTGVIPKGQYFVYGTHEDSFDSRYQLLGWINHEDILGVAYPLW